MTGRAGPGSSLRACVAFRSVNRRDTPEYDPGLQRHHLLPRQLLYRPCFARLFDAIGHETLGFSDFRRNGLLLPADEGAAKRLALPLHRGPHRSYNEMVIERVGDIESDWASRRRRAPEIALGRAAMRLATLQRSLRGTLLDGRTGWRLSRKCPLGSGTDFTELDAMAEALWLGTQPVFAASSAFA